MDLMRSALLLGSVLLLAVGTSCAPASGLTVEFYIDEDYRFSPSERDVIEAIAHATVPEARRMLPALPRDLILKVYPGTDVIPETGESGSTALTDRVFWVVHPRRPEGVKAIAKRELRGTLFHELHHLVRSRAESSIPLRQRVISEGLATAFERDAAGMPAPWGQYPPNVDEWARELFASTGTISSRAWMSRHPDGRRWVGYKVGTYIADRAIRASGKSAADLATVPSAEILRLAGFTSQ